MGPMDRAYSLLEIRSVDDDERVIEGIASTPSTDRMGDIVEPMGAEYALPIPFLWQHESRESPIGHVVSAKPTESGIPVRIQIEKDDEPGPLKDRLDYAWRSIKKGLVRGLSIGFRGLEESDIKGSWGIRYQRWEWLELSAVTIPANQDASISLVKSIDAQLRAATGQEQKGEQDRKKEQPGASGTKSVKIIPRSAPPRGAMNIAEQIQNFEHTRAAKAARRTEIQEKAAGEGRSKDDAEREEFDTLGEELKSIDAELKDLRELEKEAATTAKAVDGTTTKAASDSRDPRVIVKPEEKLDKGIEFARFAMCVAAAKGDTVQAYNLAKTHYPNMVRIQQVLKAANDRGASVHKMFIQHKAAVAAGTTTDETWAAPLLAYNNFAGDFVEYLRPRTILGQFGQNGVPDVRRIPFNVHIKGQTSGGTGYWVGEGAPKPVTSFDFNDAYHGYTKVAAIAVLTEELIRFSDPSAERLVRDALADTLIARVDSDLVDPAITASSGVRPASLTNGVTPIASSGTDADAVRADIAALWAAALAANLPLTSAVYITTPALALQLSLMRNALGQREFDGVTMTGGRIDGVPTIVSNYVPAGTFILAFASEIYLSDDGGATIDASREASIQMLDNPTNNPTGDTVATTMVSMYQTDSVALRAHRFINWSKRRTSAVALLEDVEWGSAGGS